MSNKNYFQRLIGRFAPGGMGMEKGSGNIRHGRRVMRTRLRNEDTFNEFVSAWGRQDEIPLNVQSIRQILRDADEGSPGALAVLFRRILDSEPAITSHFRTRILAALACDWSVSSETHPRRAAEAEKLLRCADLRSLMEHLLEGIAYGYAASAIIWEDGGGAIRKFMHIDPANILFDGCGNPALLGLDGREHPFAEYHENQFVYHIPCSGNGSPVHGALLRPLVWLYFFKTYAMRDRARYLERFGIPFIAAKIRNEDFESEELRNELLDSLSKIGSDGVGLMNEGAEIEIVNSSGSASGDYQSWLDYIDRLCTVLLLGQSATSSDGSGFSNGSVQEHVRRDLLEADCRALSDTIQRAVLAPLERFRWGSDGTLVFRMDHSLPENLLEKAQIVEKLSASGVQIDPAWIEKTFQIRLDQSSQQGGK